MKKGIEKNLKKSDLHRCAEKELAKIQFKPEEYPYDKHSILELVNDLRAHQIELEMQNEELKQAEEALRKSEEKYRITLQGLPDSVCIIRIKDATYQYVNNAFTNITGYTPNEAIAKTPYDLNLPANHKDRDIFVNCIIDYKKKGIDSVEMKCRKKDGSIIDVITSASPTSYEDEDCYIMVMTNITTLKHIDEEKERLEAKLAHINKIESIGAFAGGIAHDLNNILSVITGYTELALDDADYPEKVELDLTEALKASRRAKDLVSQILTFAKQPEKKYTPVMLSFTIKESLKMLRSMMPRNIVIRDKLISSAMVMADPTQIYHVMVNLFSNSLKAMSKSGGELDVNLKEVMLSVTEAFELNLDPGEYLILSIKDTGYGMTDKAIKRLFDPYSATKGTKEHAADNGLSLSVVQEIIRRHKGVIRCKSKPGKGTTFEIYLPIVEHKEPELKSPMDMTLPKGTERILFVDDEPDLASLAKKTLGNLGYKVTSTTSSHKALSIFEINPDKFDLVVTDMSMPDIMGDTLAVKMLEIRKDIPIILCTGYSEHISEQKAKSLGIEGFLIKPFLMRELARTIRRVLNRP